MSTLAARVAAHPVFAALDADGIATVAECGSEVTFGANEIVTRVDQPADEFFLVEKGRVAIELDEVARPRLMISTVTAGGVLGVSWILPPYQWTFDARALEDTEAVRVDASCLRAKCDADPVLGYALYKTVAGLIRDRLVAARFQLLDLYGSHGG